jgi:[ribosomal protein S18]-alanine N-acetyltransferase
MPDDHRRLGSKPKTFEIRRARLADIDALARLEAESFASDTLSRRSFLGLVKSPSAAFLVASCGEQLLGYAVVLFRRGTRSARLYSIAVAANEAGKGVGSRLLDAAEDAGRKRKAERLHLEVRADNAAAIRFYRQKGYQETGRRDGYYEDGMSALLFSRPLATAAESPARRAA